MASNTGRSPDVARLTPWLSGAALLALTLVPLHKFVSVARDDLFAYDFRQTFLPAAEALLDGNSPYPEYGYPPLVAFVSVPFALAPSPEILVTVVMTACVPASLWLLGVRDWRCYAAAFLWISVFNAIQTANVTLPLLLAAAACWRWRDRARLAALSGGLGVAAKIVAWPLAVWLALTRRWTAAVGVIVVAGGVTIGLWAMLGFSGLKSYPDSLDRLQGRQGDRGYTFQALASDAGFADEVGVFLAVACLAVVLLGVALYARRGDDTRSFACAVVAMILASPIVWLHSFALLLAPVAVLRPRLSAVWFLPGAMWLVSTGTGNGSTWQTAGTMVGAAVVVVVVLRQGSGRPRSRIGARDAVAAPVRLGPS